MSQKTVLIKKLRKSSEITDWTIELLINSDEQLIIPIKENGKTHIGETLFSLVNLIKDVPSKYPFEYNLLNVENRQYKEAVLNLIGEKTMSVDITLETLKYISNNIKQSNWVAETENITNVESFTTGETLDIINSNAILDFEDYQIDNKDKNPNRFWLIFDKQKIKVTSPNSFKAPISGYAWPENVSIPNTLYNIKLKEELDSIEITYTGIDNIMNDTSIPIENYQLPTNELKKIHQEGINFNQLLLNGSKYIAVSLQYNTSTMNIVLNGSKQALEAIVYGNEYSSIKDLLDALKTNKFKGYNINKEMLKPLYTYYKELLLEYRQSQPMPLVLYNGYQTNSDIYGLDILSWEEELSISNNPIQYKGVTATINGEPLNTIAYTEVIQDTLNAITEEARRKIAVYNYGNNKEIKFPNNPLTEKNINKNKEAEVTASDANLAEERVKVMSSYINNINPIPPFDDRLYFGEAYTKHSIGKEELPYDYVNRVRIGDVFLPIPPTGIKMDRIYQGKKVQTMRTSSSLQMNVGSSRNILTLNIYFANLEDINGKKVPGYIAEDGRLVDYYMDGLRPLIAQFKKAPFLPIDNEYINISLGIDNVVLRSLQVATVPGFPEALKATLIVEEFDLQPYVIGEKQLGSLINYPLLRYHYQRSMHHIDKNEVEPYKTYLPEIKALSNDFSFTLIDENSLLSIGNLDRTLRSMTTPMEYEKEIEEELMEDLDDKNIVFEEIKEDHAMMKELKEQTEVLLNEWNNKTLMKKYGLENHYKDIEDLPVYPGGYVYVPIFSSENEKAFIEELKELVFKGREYSFGEWFANSNIPPNKVKKIPYIPTSNYLKKEFRNYSKHVLSRGPWLKTEKNAEELDGGIFLFDINKENLEYLHSVYNKLDNYIKRNNNYKKAYQDIIEKIHKTEESIEKVEYVIGDIIPISMTIGLENNFSTAQVQTAETPTMQFFGAVDPEVMITFETTDAGVSRLETLFRKVAKYTKQYREGIVAGFLGINNPLVQLFGINDIIPINIEYNTIEGYPDRKIVTLTASGFNKTQRRQESIYGFLGGNVNEKMKDRIYSKYDPEKDRQFVNRYMSQMELYPDLELPKVSELNKALKTLPGFSIKEFPNMNDQVYLDPDFYVSTNTTLKTIINDVLKAKEDTELRLNDTVGYQIDISKNKGTITNFPKTSKSAAEFEKDVKLSTYTDSNLIWENYGNEQKFQPVIIGVTHGPLISSSLANGANMLGTSSSNNGIYGGTPVEIPNEILEVPTVQKIITRSATTGGTGNKLLGITLHDTGDRNAGHNAQWMHDYQVSLASGNTGEEPKSWHYQVDDKQAIQSYTHDIKCYHAGDGVTENGGNMASIGIEMCVNSDGNFVQAVNNTASLMAALCFTYNWHPLKDIKTHQQRSGKHCPNELLNGRDGWTVEKILELTNKKLQQIKSKTPQGIIEESTIAKNVNTSHNIPEFIEWIEWEGNYGKNLLDYENWIKEVKSNKIPEEKLWFKIADLVIKYFGSNLLTGEFEIGHIRQRSVPYKKDEYPNNIEQEYNKNSALGILSFAGADEIYALRMSKKKDGDLLKHGRKPAELTSSNFISSLKDYHLEKDSFQRIVLYIKAVIQYHSGGKIHNNSLSPILSDKNSKGEFTRGGLTGYKLTSSTSVQEMQQLIWDWEYNLEAFIKKIAEVYNTAKQNDKKEIRYQALEWAIASHSWIDTPKYLLSGKEEDDNHLAYENGNIDVRRNPYFNLIEEKTRDNVNTQWSDDSVKMLYSSINGTKINNIYKIYNGIVDKRTSIEKENLNLNDFKYMKAYINDLATKQAEEQADKEIAALLNSGTIKTSDINKEKAKLVEKIKKEKMKNLEKDELEEDASGNDSSDTENKIFISQKYTPWDNLEATEGMYHDALSYNQTGRLLRAFPTFIVQLIDEGKWFSNFRTWDNFYGYNAISSIDIYKSRKIVSDTAIVEMSNMYSGLTTKATDAGYNDLNKPSFFSNMFWDKYILGNPTEEIFEQRKIMSKTMSLKPGARLHIRMGYGSNPFGLPIMFNGVISEVNTGEIVTIVAQGDGIELTNAISGEEGEDNKGLFGDVKAPRDVVGRIMTSKGNWIKEILNDISDSYLFRNTPSGIAHFGAIIESQEGNRLMFNDDYGESMINFYTNDGTGNKTQFISGDQTIQGIDVMLTVVSEGAVEAAFGEDSTFNEDNILVNIYGQTIWDIIQTFALCSPDYHAAVVPFEYRSTLFFGKLHWPIIYAYDTNYVADLSTGKWYREMKENGFLMKTFMQAHIVNSQYNLVSNNIKASSDGVYNNVIVQYDGHQSPVIQADSDIKFDNQRTAYVNAPLLMRHSGKIIGGVRNFFTSEVQVSIYGHSTVRDYMKDMYKGNYIIIGEPSIKPYDIVHLRDSVHDMEGINAVKAVHHSMSLDSGFISTIEPDAYIVNFDIEGIYFGLIASAIGKSIQNKMLAATMRGSSLFNDNGIESNFIISSNMKKMFDIVTNVEAFPYAKGFSSSYIAALVRKSMGIFFREIGHILSDTTISEAGLLMEDTNKELTPWDIQDLIRYLNNYTESKYPVAIQNYIKENESIRRTIYSFKSKQKAFFAGIDARKKIQILIDESKEFANDFYEFWKQYRFEAFVDLQHFDFESKEDFVGLLHEYGLDESDVPADVFEKMLNKSDVSGLLPRTAESSSQRTFMQYMLLGLKSLASIPLDIGNTAIDLLAAPYSLVTTSTAALSQTFIMQEQNAQCIKVIPMTYKGSSFLAAMEGHRGGVWGDTPSQFDDWFKSGAEIAKTIDNAANFLNYIPDLIEGKKRD